MLYSFRRIAISTTLIYLTTSGFATAAPTIIELTQVPCQFIESENGIDHSYKSSHANDCIAINKTSLPERVKTLSPMELEAGEYIFRVHNRNVPYDLGFWLRGKGVFARATLPSISGGGLRPGMTKDYAITLTPGEYLYSCPLNPTPDYSLRVTK